MIRKKRTSQKKFSFRRAIAGCIALCGLWLLTLASAPAGLAHPLAFLSQSEHFVTTALAAQLGTGAGGSEQKAPTWTRLLLGESALLAAWQPRDLAAGNEGLDDTEDERKEPKLQTAPQTQVVERCFDASDTESYARADDVYILNRTAKSFDVAAVAAMAPKITLGAPSAPQILIMHTHGSESYAKGEGDDYVESGTARTINPTYNTIRVGDEIERIFTEMGLSVLHDTTLYDYPSYNGAYERSKAAVTQYLADYPSIQIVLDVHRDALVGQDGTIYKAVTEIDGTKTAQVLFVIGTDESGAKHPDWQNNLGLSMRVQHRMNTLWPGLARPITLRTSSFSQQLTPGSMLVEVGAHGNTLAEALAGARLFARSAGQVFLELRA